MTVPEHDPVYKVTIIPRGRALGVTMFLPEQDRYSTSKRQLESRIATLFGGRVAEELVFGPDAVTTGASNDIERATELARNMVTRWGLSDRLGPQTYSEESGEVFLGRSVTQHKQVSDVTAHVIDEEVRRVIDSNYQRAYKIIQTNMDKLQTMSEALDQVRDHRRGADQGHHGGPGAASAARLGRYADHRRREAARGREAGAAAGQSGGSALDRRAVGRERVQAARPASRSAALMATAAVPHDLALPHRLLDLTPPAGHGRAQCHARFVLRRRPLRATSRPRSTRARRMVAEGAAIIDVGGESTRPGRRGRGRGASRSSASCRSWSASRRTLDVAISIDTSKPGVMAAAVAAGACIVNDVYALRAPGAREWAARRRRRRVPHAHAGRAAHHAAAIRRYRDVVAEVAEFLLRERDALPRGRHRRSRPSCSIRAWVSARRLEHNMALLQESAATRGAWARRCWSACRARASIGRMLGRPPSASACTAGWAWRRWRCRTGARIVRTHDVASDAAMRCGWSSAVLQGRAAGSWKVSRYFGTDGVRGRVGEAPMTVDFALRLASAAARVLAPRRRARAHRQGHARCRATCSSRRSRRDSSPPAWT